MSFPNFPNPARRARILQAHQRRQQGLTLRQIGEIMDCAPSTVAGYLRDYELFRTDLMRELAGDQIVNHLIHLADVDDPHHDQRLADLREYRLLLAALPQIRSDEEDRTYRLNQGGVFVDHYGNRYPIPDRLYVPTSEEQEQSQQPPANTPNGRPNPDTPLAYLPQREQDLGPPPPGEVSRSDGGGATQAPSLGPGTSDEAIAKQSPQPLAPAAPRGEMPQAAGSSPDPQPTNSPVPDPVREPAPPLRLPQPEPKQTESNKPEQDSAPNPGHNSTSPDPDQNSLPPATQQALDDIERQLSQVLRQRDWLNDYPPHNPFHPQRERALKLVERRDALLARAAQSSSA